MSLCLLTLEKQIQQLTNIELRNENDELRKRIVELESSLQAEIDKLNKNSNKSSTPGERRADSFIPQCQGKGS